MSDPVENIRVKIGLIPKYRQTKQARSKFQLALLLISMCHLFLPIQVQGVLCKIEYEYMSIKNEHIKMYVNKGYIYTLYTKCILKENHT